LEFSKLEKKQRRFAVHKGSFDEVIQEVKDIMQPKLQQEGFTLNLEKREVRPFKYDREVMVQILVNLIENSMKFGKASPTKEIALRIRSEHNTAKISVADTGPGIPRPALKRVFDDFYRVDSSQTQATGGSGIGLAIVKKFVVAMGGSVTAANNDGPGCTITISLPL
jgi:two-component system sensor histidine kinase VicK